MKPVRVIATMLIICLFFSSSCKTGPVPGTERSALQKTWKHSYEEASTDGSEIFRPADYKTFAPSMFRQVYDFQANGQCAYLVLHPADAHYMAKGTWSYNESSRLLEIKDASAKTVATFEVIEITADKLRLKRL